MTNTDKRLGPRPGEENVFAAESGAFDAELKLRKACATARTGISRTTPTDDLDALRRIGRLLYGPRWIAPLARDLELHWGPTLRTMHRWNSGASAIPPDIWPLLAMIAKSKANDSDIACQIANEMSERTEGDK